MPAALVAAADLVLLAFIMLCIAFLMGVKVTVTPALEVVAALVSKVPLIGSAGANLVVRAENAILFQLDATIKASEGVAAGLWRALVWTFEQMRDALEGLAGDVHSALVWVSHTRIPHAIAAGVAGVVSDVAALEKRVTKLVTDEAADVLALGASIKNGLTDLRRDVGADVAGAVRTAEGYVDTQLAAAERDLRREIGTAVGGAEALATKTIDALRNAEEEAVRNLNLAIAGAESTAEQFAAGLVASAASELAGVISHAEARAAAAEGVIAGEVTDVTDHLKTLLGDLSFADVAALLASIPALAVLVHTIAEEAGLGRAETRGKVKAICSVDPELWGSIVAGLLLFDGIPSLRELVDGAGALLREIEGPIIDLVRPG